MDSPLQTKLGAWQPLTPRGIAAFARGSLGRLLAVQFVFALVVAAACMWFLDQTWYPVISAAISRLPPEGELRSGRLDWRADSPLRLAEGRFLAVVVDLKHEGSARSPAHLTVELGERDFKLISLLGFASGSYPRHRVLAFNRPQTEPWWGAWSAPLLVIAAAGVILELLLAWALLATVCFLPVALAGFFADRDLTLGGAWRLAGAALMPGGLLMAGAIVLYGLGILDVVLLGIVTGSHFLVGGFYMAAGVVALPPHPSTLVTHGNPFGKT